MIYDVMFILLAWLCVSVSSFCVSVCLPRCVKFAIVRTTHWVPPGGSGGKMHSFLLRTVSVGVFAGACLTGERGGA